jgi:hypothetical protein
MPRPESHPQQPPSPHHVSNCRQQPKPFLPFENATYESDPHLRQRGVCHSFAVGSTMRGLACSSELQRAPACSGVGRRAPADPAISRSFPRGLSRISRIPASPACQERHDCQECQFLSRMSGISDVPGMSGMSGLSGLSGLSGMSGMSGCQECQECRPSCWVRNVTNVRAWPSC